MYLESILSLSSIEEVTPELVRFGLLGTLATLYSESPDKEILLISAQILDKFVPPINTNIPSV